MYRQGGSHHSSNGDQLGRAGRRRQSLGVPPGRKPPQLKRRPTGQGREEEAESRCTAREGATIDNSRSRGRRQRRSTPVQRCEIEKISCNLTGTRSTFFFSFFFFLFFFSFSFFFLIPLGIGNQEREGRVLVYHQGGSHHSSNGDQLGRAGRRRQSLGVQPGREPPQLKRRPTGQGREEEAESQAYSQGGSHHSSNGDQLGRAGRRRQSLGVQPGREQPQTTHAAGGGGKGGVHQSIGVRLRKSAAI